MTNPPTEPLGLPNTAADGPPVVRRGAVAIIVREARCLMIRRAEGIAVPGAYCFPGGGIEDGETEAQAVRRELRGAERRSRAAAARLGERHAVGSPFGMVDGADGGNG